MSVKSVDMSQMWTKATVKCPDEGDWVAIIVVEADGETSLIGYTSREAIEGMLRFSESLSRSYKDWLERE